jgi:hypothetical protein
MWRKHRRQTVLHTYAPPSKLGTTMEEAHYFQPADNATMWHKEGYPCRFITIYQHDAWKSTTAFDYYKSLKPTRHMSAAACLYVGASKRSRNPIILLKRITPCRIVWCQELVSLITSLHSEFYHLQCWFIAFENVSYKTICKQKIVCFATQTSFWDIMNARRRVCNEGNAGLRVSIIKVLVIATQVSMTIGTGGGHQLQQMMKTLSVCKMLCETTNERIIRRY